MVAMKYCPNCGEKTIELKRYHGVVCIECLIKYNGTEISRSSQVIELKRKIIEAQNELAAFQKECKHEWIKTGVSKMSQDYREDEFGRHRNFDYTSYLSKCPYCEAFQWS